MFTANRAETARQLLPLAGVLDQLPHPKPLVVLGGQAFETMRLPEILPAEYIQASPVETVQVIENLMLENGRHRQLERAAAQTGYRQ